MVDLKEQSLRLWQNMNNKHRYIILGTAAGLFLAILFWSYWWGGRPDNVPLFTTLEAEDAGKVTAKLKEMKVPYEVQTGSNGTVILVASKDVHRLRLDLASQGLPRGNKGFEIFDQNKFGATEFQNKVQLLQAIQGELTRTIEQMEEVEKARVHIVMSEDSLYKKSEKPATASIMLKLKPSTQLSQQQVKGIVNLVGHSVQGLKPENITVVDNLARVLNDQSEAPQMAGTTTLTQFEMTKKVQDDLQKNVQSLLDQTLGMGKAAARVNVELNFDQRTLDRQTFEPVVDDKGIVRSSQELNENYKGNSGAPGGVPGITSNIPGYVTGNNSQSNYEKKEVTRNYEINETKEKVVSTPGSIKRVTVAVLVDAAVPKAQQDSLSKTVATAIGINPSRGDNVAVESIQFSTELADKQRKDEEEQTKQQQQALILKVGLIVIAIIAILYLIRMYTRRREQEEEFVESLAVQPQPIAEAEAQTARQELTAQEKERAEQRTTVEKFAKSRPEDVAQLMKTWLAEE
ncbi:flagellar basal-body MS-ring/collar protein FliF [Sporomusa sp.]|uniref:flagellar basal-body MS-ring/collar protein FliF n=1 Tax=Sporomusa sp. TaxID=2078658 RepID=UPI002B60DEC3|nr:flagellar basal-body MS-ring/collar protein FliF [Sporomusa sp.]HWR43171.1 flagellar basal-body MS-ring/collar protein FliF [Sporomusa sp.]